MMKIVECKMRHQDELIGDLTSLLRDALATKLNMAEMQTLLDGVDDVVSRYNVNYNEEVKDTIGYIDHKCRDIERSLNNINKHRNRHLWSVGMRTNSHPGRSIPRASRLAPRNPWFDSYFS